MAQFYYNSGIDQSYSAQWTSFMQTNSLVQDINNQIDKQSRVIQDSSEMYVGAVTKQGKYISDNIQSMGEGVVRVVRSSAEQIIGSLSNDISTMSEQIVGRLNGISSGLDNISHRLDKNNWLNSKLFEQTMLNNILTQNIAALLRIPDVQKERQFYIENGLKCYANGSYDNDLYAEALEYFNKALDIYKSDYFVLHRIGMILLYCDGYVDVEKAEQYFRKAAKYSIVEAQENAVVLADYLAMNPKLNFNTQKASKEKVKIISSESYFQAATACYIQGKFNEAEDLYQKSIDLCPNYYDAIFYRAKALCALKNGVAAKVILNDLFHKKQIYVYMTLSDIDLLSNPTISELLFQIKDEKIKEAEFLLDELIKTDLREAKALYDDLKSQLDKNTYFDAAAVTKKLAEDKCEWLIQDVKSRLIISKYYLSYYYDKFDFVAVINSTYVMENGLFNDKINDNNELLKTIENSEKQLYEKYVNFANKIQGNNVKTVVFDRKMALIVYEQENYDIIEVYDLTYNKTKLRKETKPLFSPLSVCFNVFDMCIAMLCRDGDIVIWDFDGNITWSIDRQFYVDRITHDLRDVSHFKRSEPEFDELAASIHVNKFNIIVNFKIKDTGFKGEIKYHYRRYRISLKYPELFKADSGRLGETENYNVDSVQVISYLTLCNHLNMNEYTKISNDEARVIYRQFDLNNTITCSVLEYYRAYFTRNAEERINTILNGNKQYLIDILDNKNKYYDRKHKDEERRKKEENEVKEKKRQIEITNKIVNLQLELKLHENTINKNAGKLFGSGARARKDAEVQIDKIRVEIEDLNRKLTAIKLK